MNAFYAVLLVVVSFMFGAVYGEAKAPISGVTVQALAARISTLEARLDMLTAEYVELSTAVFGRDAGR